MTKLNANALALSAVITTAILWVLCSLLVMLMPGMSMSMSGYMMHTDLSGMQWQLGLAGFLAGLVLWSLLAGIMAWLFAFFYNRLL